MQSTIDKSISELEGWKWKGEVPKENGWYTEYRFYQLHAKPLKELELTDFYFLVLENSALNYLVPIVIEKIKDNLFIEVENYPGDLFCSLLLINNTPNYWSSHPKEKQDLINLYSQQKSMKRVLDISDDIKVKIKEAYKEFLNK